jgi:hypothetical protein
MLGIKDDFKAMILQVTDRILYNLLVFFLCASEDFSDMQCPGLTENNSHWDLRFEYTIHRQVVLDPYV